MNDGTRQGAPDLLCGSYSVDTADRNQALFWHAIR